MEKVRITVVTVCYNASDVIEQTMRSVLDQTYSNIEYIVVDGASKDNTLDIVKKVGAAYPKANIVILYWWWRRNARKRKEWMEDQKERER